MKTLPKAGPFSLLCRVLSSRRPPSGSSHCGLYTSIHTSPVCAFPPPRWTGPGLNHRKWTKEGGIGRRGQEEIPPPPFSLLCNLLIRFGREPGTLQLREGGLLRSREACGERPPLPLLLPSRGAQVFLLRPLGGEGRLAATSLAPHSRATQSCPRCVWSPVLRGSSVSGVPVPPPVSRVPRGLPAPVLWRCLCPRVRDAALRSQFPSGSGVCMGKSLCQLCRWVMWFGEGWTAGSPPPRLSVGLLAPGITQ